VKPPPKRERIAGTLVRSFRLNAGLLSKSSLSVFRAFSGRWRASTRPSQQFEQPVPLRTHRLWQSAIAGTRIRSCSLPASRFSPGGTSTPTAENKTSLYPLPSSAVVFVWVIRDPSSCCSFVVSAELLSLLFPGYSGMSCVVQFQDRSVNY
jgi:hypothetical protein